MNSCKSLLQNALIDIELDNLHVGGDADHTGENCTRERVHEGYGSPHILMWGLARARYLPEMSVWPGRDAAPTRLRYVVSSFLSVQFLNRLL